MTSGSEEPRPSRWRLLSGLLGNSALRAATIATKSALIFALAAWLEPEELGHYGLIAAIVALTNTIYGLDFHTFVVRDISLANLGDARRKLRDQFTFHGVLYLLAAFVLAWWVPALGLSADLVPLVVLVTVFQHATQELYRVLVRLLRVFEASVVFFVRDAGWIPLIFLKWWITGSLDLLEILAFWLGGSLVATAFAIVCLVRRTPKGVAAPPDWAWLRKGLRVGLRMLPGTLSLRSLFSVDRMLLAVLVLPDTLGAYVFFTGLCMAFYGLFESGVLPYYWPELLEAEKSEDPARIALARRRLTQVCWLGLLGIVLASGVAGWVATHLLDKPVYSQNLDLLPILGLAYGFLAAGYAPHYMLFAKGRDHLIVGSQLAGLAALGLVTLIAAQLSARLAVPSAVLVAGLLMLVAKWVLARRLGLGGGGPVVAPE